MLKGVRSMASGANGKKRHNMARGERLQIMLSPDELTVVDDFRFRKRMPSRAAAVRELFRLGLAAAGLAQETAGKKSADFGVIEDRRDARGT
jgi:hypothetical protein